MIVDMQVGVINKFNKHLIDRINKLIYENKFDEIIYTKFINKDFSAFEKFLNWKGVKTEDKTAFSVEYKKKSLIFEKTSYGLTEEQLRILKNKNIDEIYLCGTDLDACILAIAYQLFDCNIRPLFLIEDCGSGSGNKKFYKQLEGLLVRNFGTESIRK